MRFLLSNEKLALAFCLVGRAVDFATSWIALAFGRAAEAKTGAAQIIQSLGPTGGLFFCEFAITTPVIFIGYLLAKRIGPFRRLKPGEIAPAIWLPPEIALFYYVGAVSFAIGLHNCTYII